MTFSFARPGAHVEGLAGFGGADQRLTWNNEMSFRNWICGTRRDFTVP
jgi:hypothetical protein